MKPFPIALSTLLAVLIITVGVTIRLTNINQPLLEFFPPRQTQTAEITRNIYKNGAADFWTPKVRYFTPPQAGQAGEPIPYVLEFPLYNGLVALFYHAFGPNVIWGRFVSLTFFIGSSFIFYKLVSSTTKQFLARGQSAFGGNNLTIFALLFFTFSPLHILTSRSFQPEELALFLLLLSIYKKSWLIFSLAVLTKLPIALFAPVLIYQQLRNQHSTVIPGLTRNLYKISAKIFVSLIPSLIWYFRASRLTVHPAIARNFDLTNWFQPQLWLDPKWYFSIFQIEHIWILTTLGLLFFWLGLWRIILKRRLLAVRQGVSLLDINIWIVWSASGLFYLGIFNYHAMTHEYYHLFLLPPLSIFVGTGINQIVKITKGFSKYVRVVSAAGILLLFIMGLIQPAIRKIISAPKSPPESTEITPARYRLIEDF